MQYTKLARKQLRHKRQLVCARYTGPRIDLRNKTALVRMPARKGEPSDMLMAQFDKFHLRESLGWHPFKPSDFKLRPSISATADQLAAEFRTFRSRIRFRHNK